MKSLKSRLCFLVLVIGLAACSSGNTSSDSEATASLSEPEAQSASTGFSESDLSGLRPETEQSRETLWRLKGKSVQRQLRR